MVGAHYAALQDRPKAFNRIRMNRSDYVLLRMMPDRVVWIVGRQTAVGGMLVRVEKANLGRNAFADEFLETFRLGVLDDAGHDVTLALGRADHDGLAGAFAATAATPLIPMLVLVLPTDIGFIDFDDAHELAEFLVSQSSPNAMAHMPSGAIGAEAHCPINLMGGNAFLARQHHVNDTEPVAQADVGILEDGPDQNGKAVGRALPTFHALPLEGHGFEFADMVGVATRTANTNRPAVMLQVSLAGIIGRESRFPLAHCHLMNSLGGAHISLRSN